MLEDIRNQDFLSLLNKSELDKTNTVFWLHSKVNVMFLVISAVIINLNTYVGDPIDCISNNKGTMMFSDNFCWIYGTSTFGGSEDEKTEKYEYYQWVALTLLAQAVFFYLPGWLWSYWEKGHIKQVVGDNGVKILDDTLVQSRERCEEISDNIAKKVLDDRGSHNKWAAKFILCEVLNFFTTISQIIFTNKFLNENFLDYGYNVIKYVIDPDNENNPMEKTFPILTSCKQHAYGSGMEVNTIDFLCVLPANIWNQKLYLFLSFWWSFLATAGAIQLTYRLLTIVSPQLRRKIESWPGQGRYWSDYSDWLFFRYVLKNSNPILRKDIRTDVSRVVKNGPTLSVQHKTDTN